MHSFTPASADHALRHVFLRDMVLLASIGVHAFEHEARQRIRINLDLAVIDEAEAASRQLTRAPAAKPGAKDDLHRVVDYEAVAGRVRDLVASGHVRLLETLAERIAEACLEDARVRIVRIRIEKLDIFADMASVGIEIERRAGPSAEQPAN
jgi:dihydroneopterin aldolase